MTNNELIEIINRMIDEYFSGRIRFYSSLENDRCETHKYDSAFRYQVSREENETTRNMLKNNLHRLLESLDLGTNDSTYKEMWEELKKEIGNIKEEHIAEINCYVKSNMYGLAECSANKNSEDNYILDTIEGIEKRRGIEK